jgi:uncharacterized protein YneF (UPF0154 family)
MVVGIVLFCIIGCEFFIQYRFVFRKKEKKNPPAAIEQPEKEVTEEKGGADA